MRERRYTTSNGANWSRRAWFAVLMATPWAAHSQITAPAEVSSALPGLRLQGGGRLTYFALHIYDARLWVDATFHAPRFADAPLALELEYARSLQGELIAQRSLKEIRRTGDIGTSTADTWLAAMTRLFPDVAKGDRLTAVHQPGQALRFFFNGKLQGRIDDAEFAHRFIAIWLAPQTSEPQLRQALLGERGSSP